MNTSGISKNSMNSKNDRKGLNYQERIRKISPFLKNLGGSSNGRESLTLDERVFSTQGNPARVTKTGDSFNFELKKEEKGRKFDKNIFIQTQTNLKNKRSSDRSKDDDKVKGKLELDLDSINKTPLYAGIQKGFLQKNKKDKNQEHSSKNDNPLDKKRQTQSFIENTSGLVVVPKISKNVDKIQFSRDKIQNSIDEKNQPTKGNTNKDNIPIPDVKESLKNLHFHPPNTSSKENTSKALNSSF